MLIDYRNVEVNHGNEHVLNNVDFQLEKGQFVYLVGKVGSGESSFLSTIYGEVPIKNGEASVLGFNMRKIKRKHIPELRRGIGVIFQDFQLLTDRTIRENLMFVLQATGWKKKDEMNKRIEEVLSEVKMLDAADKMPNALSGGQQQRVVIARAILNKPQLIIADEPTGNLDVNTGKQICQLLHNISKQGASVIMSTHNIGLVSDFPGITYSCVGHELELISSEGIRTETDKERLNAVLLDEVLV